MSITQSGLEGLQRAQAAAERSAARVAKFPLSLGDPSADVVDLSAEAVALMAAQNAFEVSARMVETGDQMNRTALDIMA